MHWPERRPGIDRVGRTTGHWHLSCCDTSLIAHRRQSAKIMNAIQITVYIADPTQPRSTNLELVAVHLQHCGDLLYISIRSVSSVKSWLQFNCSVNGDHVSIFVETKNTRQVQIWVGVSKVWFKRSFLLTDLLNSAPYHSVGVKEKIKRTTLLKIIFWFLKRVTADENTKYFELLVVMKMVLYHGCSTARTFVNGKWIIIWQSPDNIYNIMVSAYYW